MNASVDGFQGTDVKRFYRSGSEPYGTVIRSQRLGSVLAVVALCILLAVGPAAVTDAAEPEGDNETQHRHPDMVGNPGNLAAIQDWLAGRMTEIHLDCASNLSVGETLACDRLDEEYPEYLDKFAAVERDRTGGTNTSQTFEQAREDQTELAELIEEFWATYDDYQAARNEGDRARSRRLARELAGLAARIEDLGGSLNVVFAELGDRTGRDYGDTRTETNQTTAIVIRTTTRVQNQEFTPAELTASIPAATASFREPAVVRGRLTAENGSALSNRTVWVRVDTRTVSRVETDANGTYEAEYRPVITSTGPTTVAAGYEPTGTDPYLGTNATATVDVDSVSASLGVTVDDGRVAFGDSVPVTARVSVLGTRAEGVPVTVSLGGQRIAAGRTGSDGTLDVAGALPATVRNGTRTLSVRASTDGRALAPAIETRSVTVAESPTALSLEGTLDGEELVVSGRLTANGQPVSGQRVGVSVDGEIREIARTAEDGRYRVRVPRETGGRGVWSVTADYNNPSTNLAPTATTRYLSAGEVAITTGTERETSFLGKLRQLVKGIVFLRTLSDRELLAVVGGALAVVLLTVGAVGRYVRRRLGGQSGGGDGPTPAVVDTSAPEAVDEPAESTADASSSAVDGADALDVARARLGAGEPNRAVKIGYGAVRRELTDLAGPDDPDSRTHWELYSDLAAELSDERAAALERLTLAYERAEFAPDGTGRGTARAALNAAATCLSVSANGQPEDVA